jgi:hypothetical protein
MTYRIAACCTAVLAFGATSLLPADDSAQRPGEVSTTERMNFASGGTIRFNNSFGDLYVQGWDRPELEITLVKWLQDVYKPPQAAGDRLARVQFITEHASANELTIKTTTASHKFFRHPFGGKGDVTVRYELRVPRDSHLIIQHGGGNILIDNVTGGVEATNREGDIMLMLPGGPYSIDAKSKMGTVTSDFAGKARHRYFVGERFTGSDRSPRRIFLRVGFGGITIKEVPPEGQP